MNEITNKAIVIAVGIFITVAITSGILISIDKMKEIYEKVYETDISLKNNFSEFDQYDNTRKKGIDVANAINKYTRGDYSSYVTINVIDPSISNNSTAAFWLDDEKIKKYNDIYSYNYNTTLNIDNDGRVTITFNKI